MRVLIVEDDERLAVPVADDLRRQHHVVDVASDGDAGLAIARSGIYDVILLDVMLPGRDGFEICRTLRTERSEAMILMMTARDATSDVVHGLDCGADDYVVKPFELEELSARLRALGRRGTPARDAILTSGALSLDPQSRYVRYGNVPIALTPTEFTLLETLMRSPARVFSRAMLVEKIAGLESQPRDESIKSHVANLRRRLRDGGCTYDPIETLYGTGYRLREPR